MATPEQLPLELGATPAPTFDNFVATGNEEAVLRLRALIPQVVDGTATDRLVYLWGEEGSGRSHLLQAICAQTEAGGYEVRTLEPDAPPEAFEFDPTITVWTIDVTGERQLVTIDLSWIGTQLDRYEQDDLILLEVIVEDDGTLRAVSVAETRDSGHTSDHHIDPDDDKKPSAPAATATIAPTGTGTPASRRRAACSTITSRSRRATSPTSSHVAAW